MIEQNQQFSIQAVIKNKEEHLLKTHIAKGSYTKENTTSEFNGVFPC